jgi:histone-binding protein RBBP4
LLVGATGQTVCLWDLSHTDSTGKAQHTINDAHLKIINDVKFSNLNPNLFATVSDDSHFKLWDTRSLKIFTHTYQASDDQLLVVGFSHFNEHLYATAGEESGMILVWDLRMTRNAINDLNYHKGAVNQLEWCPTSEWLFMTSASDGLVYVWDQSKCGQEQARHDYEDGPPEMIYPHEWHRGVNIEDIGWSPDSDPSQQMCVSVDQEMNMQVWKMSEDFFFREVDFLDRLDLIKESDLE